MTGWENGLVDFLASSLGLSLGNSSSNFSNVRSESRRTKKKRDPMREKKLRHFLVMFFFRVFFFLSFFFFCKSKRASTLQIETLKNERRFLKGPRKKKKLGKETSRTVSCPSCCYCYCYCRLMSMAGAGTGADGGRDGRRRSGGGGEVVDVGRFAICLKE